MVFLGKHIHTESTNPKAAEKQFLHHFKVNVQKHTSSSSSTTKTVYSLVTVPYNHT